MQSCKRIRQWQFKIMNYYNNFADNDCPSSGVVKPIVVDAVPGKRFVQLTWTYDADPEDEGFSFTFIDGPHVEDLDIALRQYVLNDLRMY